MIDETSSKQYFRMVSSASIHFETSECYKNDLKSGNIIRQMILSVFELIDGYYEFFFLSKRILFFEAPLCAVPCAGDVFTMLFCGF